MATAGVPHPEQSTTREPERARRWRRAPRAARSSQTPGSAGATRAGPSIDMRRLCGEQVAPSGKWTSLAPWACASRMSRRSSRPLSRNSTPLRGSRLSIVAPPRPARAVGLETHRLPPGAEESGVPPCTTAGLRRPGTKPALGFRVRRMAPPTSQPMFPSNNDRTDEDTTSTRDRKPLCLIRGRAGTANRGSA